MKLKPRSAFDEAPFQEALKEYRNACNVMLDPLQGYEMLWRHAESLDKELGYLNNKHNHLYNQFKVAQREAQKMVLHTALTHTSNDIRNLTRARQDIIGSGYTVSDALKASMRSVNAMLDNEEVLIKGKRLNPRYIKKLHPKNALEIWDRYAELDRIYETGIAFAIDQSAHSDRAYELAKIPEEIQIAKWKFMLAYADAAYHIDIGKEHSDSIGANHLEILSGIFAKLADRERGADNVHLADTHKYRHNPAIHSLLTVSLADNLFHNVLHDIDHDGRMPRGLKKRYAERLSAMRSLVYHAALVHDIGEVGGELSQGIHVADMKADFRAEAKKARGPIEEEAFEHYLRQQRPKLHHMEKGIPTAEPITDWEWDAIFQSYKQAGELSEKTDTFMGRFFKVLECMQSQHDYLRFEHVAGTRPLVESEESNKTFSVNYAARVFYDAPWDATQAGPNALSGLAEKALGQDADIDISLQRMLAAEMERELSVLTTKNIKAYHGPDSPEMQRLRLHDQAGQRGMAF